MAYTGKQVNGRERRNYLEQDEIRSKRTALERNEVGVEPNAELLRGVGRNFALVGQKGVGPGEEEVGGSLSSPHPLDLNAWNLFSNSADIHKWQNTEQARCTAINGGRQILHSGHKWHLSWKLRSLSSI